MTPAPLVRLSKHHALGNDFLVLVDLDGRLPVGADRARALCDRRLGVGADGLIRVSPGTGEADVTMTLRNADGSRAETSGNGLRCLAQAVLGPRGGDRLTVATDAGPRRVRVLDRPDDRTVVAAAELGTAKVVAAGGGASEVDLGNPHLVVVAGPPGGGGPPDLEALGRAHPDRNVEVVTPGPEPGAVSVWVWERGVGETRACGTGAGAAAAALWDRGALPAGATITVHLPGGDLEVAAGPHGALTLTGPAVHVADLEVPWP
ncbi:MAG: diaminopimelate epimerase [Acidimicrobiales bacterium]